MNVLASMENPTLDDVHSFGDRRFAFRGFDLVEMQTGIRALPKCGGFDKAFSPADLSECGLLTDQAQALGVLKRLREEYLDEPHANCDLWAVWLLKG